MIKWLFKYGAVLVLFNSILLSIENTYLIGDQFFISLMVLYLFVLLINPNQFKKIIFHKAFSFILIINLLNLLYFFIFHSIYDYDAMKYLMARGVQFSIISISIYHNYEYYANKFLDHLVYVIFGIVIFGLIINPSMFSGRYSGIIWNPNMFSSIVVIAFAVFFLKHENRTRFDYFILFILLAASIASGSRSSLVGIILVFILKYGFTSKNLIYAFLALCVSFFVVSINLETSINRFAEQSIFNDRILQIKYAYISIQEKLVSGYGLDKYAYIDMSLVPISLKDKIIGAHNGYLAILTQYGIIFGMLISFIILKKSLQVYSFFRNKRNVELIYLFIIMFTLIASLYETFLTGINEFQTILFWFSLSFLSYSKFKKEYAV
tara:strand:+ start:331 stop:1467 length:1137 start_codon:yes stop_codon:yes gene_type:complete